jgi:hypothetical protein
MPRPGPLQELPLDQFLSPNPNLPFASKLRPNKRPLSPGGPNLYSPAKRRILNEEGIFSPEKTTKSPISSRGTPAHFTDVLSGPSSPARKLDFGVPKHSIKGVGASSTAALDKTPARPASLSNRLAPSPELKPKTRSSCPGDYEMDDYFSMPNCSSSSHSSAIHIPVPHEMPPPPDPQSVHYPGFRVHSDTHNLTPVDDDLESLSLFDNNKDGQKENLPPRRKPRKVATAPNTDLKSQLFSPDAKKREVEKLGRAKSTPVTPKRLAGGDGQEPGDSPTPRRLVVGLAQAVTSSTPRAKERERREMRRALQDEVDDADEDQGDEV